MHLSPYLGADQAPKADLHQCLERFPEGNNPFAIGYAADNLWHGILDMDADHLSFGE